MGLDAMGNPVAAGAAPGPPPVAAAAAYVDPWADTPFRPTIHPCSTDFKLNPLPAPNPAKDPLHYFNAYMDEDFKKYVVNETNRYARHTWQPGQTDFAILTLQEFDLFLSDMLYMGLCRLPNRRKYWERGIHDTIIGRALTGPRFEAILSKLHFNDNAKLPKEGDPKRKTAKIAPLFDQINKVSKLYVVPGRDASVDEQGIRSKHHSGMQQYNKDKPDKRHIKVWAIALTGGYLWHVEVYGGATEEAKAYDDEGAG